MSGYRALTKKELRESLTTSRMLITAVVFVLSGCVCFGGACLALRRQEV